jgi:hypothetical protein
MIIYIRILYNNLVDAYVCIIYTMCLYLSLHASRNVDSENRNVESSLVYNTVPFARFIHRI